jgi:D-alanine-D-alanine ligase
MAKKICVGVVFGGKSGEHEVSLVSAASVIKEMPKDKYTVKEVGIAKNGKWYVGKDVLKKFKNGDFKGLKKVSFEDALKNCDVAFPVLHGPFGEDGTIQGLFEMMNIPYVGCGVLASSLCMDKALLKQVLRDCGISVVPSVEFMRNEWKVGSKKLAKEIKFPCFVKPANMGSSVGISKVKNSSSLAGAINFAFEFDSKVLVEKAVNAREIECAILGNEDPRAAELGEIIVGGEFYDYYDKYVNGKSSTQVPVKNLAAKKKKEISEMCLMAYKAAGCSGLSRVDCFLDRKTGKVYLNEINTLPGFTSISMYPKMWQASGLNYPKLIDVLIQLGLKRFAEKQKNKISFDSGSNWFQTP